MWAGNVTCKVLRLPCLYFDCSVMYSMSFSDLLYDSLCIPSSGVVSQGNWWTGIGKRLEGSGQNTKHLLKLVTVLFGCAHLCLLQISAAFKASDQWHTQEFFFFAGRGGSTNSVEDRGQRERGSGGGSPLVRGSGGSCSLVQEILFHVVNFSQFLVL